MDQDARRVLAQAEQPRHLGERLILVVMKVDGLAFLEAEPAEGVYQLAVFRAAADLVLRVRRRCRPEAQPGFDDPTAMLVADQVGDGAIEPALELGLGPWSVG